MKNLIGKIIFVLYITAIGILCFAKFPGSMALPSAFLGIPMDKCVHFLMFLPFCVFLYWAFDWKVQKGWRKMALAVGLFIIGTLVAYSTELIQGLIPYRDTDPQDLLADGLGLATGAILVLIFEISRDK